MMIERQFRICHDADIFWGYILTELIGKKKKYNGRSDFFPMTWLSYFRFARCCHGSLRCADKLSALCSDIIFGIFGTLLQMSFISAMIFTNKDIASCLVLCELFWLGVSTQSKSSAETFSVLQYQFQTGQSPTFLKPTLSKSIQEISQRLVETSTRACKRKITSPSKSQNQPQLRIGFLPSFNSYDNKFGHFHHESARTRLHQVPIRDGSACDDPYVYNLQAY